MPKRSDRAIGGHDGDVAGRDALPATPPRLRAGRESNFQVVCGARRRGPHVDTLRESESRKAVRGTKKDDGTTNTSCRPPSSGQPENEAPGSSPTVMKQDSSCNVDRRSERPEWKKRHADANVHARTTQGTRPLR